MDNQDALKTLNDIRSMMEKSSRFQAISGIAVALVGLLATVAAFVADGLFNNDTNNVFSTLYGNTNLLLADKTKIAAIGAVLLAIVAFLTVFFGSMIHARRKKIRFEVDSTMRRLLMNFFVPLLAGGILCLALMLQGHYGLTSSIMLIFYGLALVNCHHFSHPALGVLGYVELALGLIDCFLATHALLFWAVGFGVMHIVFGIYLIVKK